MKRKVSTGRAGSSGHQNLIRHASKKLLNEVLGDKYLAVTLVREQPLDVEATVNIHGEGRIGGMRITNTKQRLYADIACAAVFDQDAKYSKYGFEVDEGVEKQLEKLKAQAKMEEYRNLVRAHYGMVSYIIECEINPRSNLLRDGPRLTAYKLIKEKNHNFVLILAVFEGTEVDNPGIFDEIWTFPRKERK